MFIVKNDYDQNVSQRDPWSGWKCSPMSSMLETKEFLDWNCQLYYWTKILTRPIQLMPYYSKHHLNVGWLFAKIRSKPFVVACAVKQAIEGLGYLNRVHINWHSMKHMCLKSVSENMFTSPWFLYLETLSAISLFSQDVETLLFSLTLIRVACIFTLRSADGFSDVLFVSLLVFVLLVLMCQL